MSKSQIDTRLDAEEFLLGDWALRPVVHYCAADIATWRTELLIKVARIEEQRALKMQAKIDALLRAGIE